MSRARLVRLALLVGGLGFMAVLFSCREMPSQSELDRAVFPGDIVSAPRVRVVLKKSSESVTLAIQVALVIGGAMVVGVLWALFAPAKKPKGEASRRTVSMDEPAPGEG